MINQIDELQLYFGEDYIINDHITIKQPTIGQIMKAGEQQYYSTISTLCAIPSDMKSQLDTAGIDYMEISDFDLFIMLCKRINFKMTYLLLGDIDLSKFDIKTSPDNGEIILQNAEGIVIDKLIYQLMIDYIRKMHGIVPKVEKAYNKRTRQILIEESRLKMESLKNKPYESMLQPMISSMVNSAGFKYNLHQVLDVKLCEFTDSVKRIQCMNHALNLTQGCYSGNVDVTKINKSELDWMKKLK